MTVLLKIHETKSRGSAETIANKINKLTEAGCPLILDFANQTCIYPFYVNLS